MIVIEHQKDVKIPIPTTRTDINENVAKLLPGKEIYAYVNKIQQHQQDKAKIYSVALVQCTKEMMNCLKG